MLLTLHGTFGDVVELGEEPETFAVLRAKRRDVVRLGRDLDESTEDVEEVALEVVCGLRGHLQGVSVGVIRWLCRETSPGAIRGSIEFLVITAR